VSVKSGVAIQLPDVAACVPVLCFYNPLFFKIYQGDNEEKGGQRVKMNFHENRFIVLRMGYFYDNH
jgi:hypothetical protein